MLSLVCLSAGFLTADLKLSSGKRISISGTGPPVLFSTGMFNTVSHRFYDDFVHRLRQRVTVITLNGLSPLREADIAEVADSIGSTKIGLITHSSLYMDVLRSPRIERAVLCDPVCLPEVDLNGFAAQSVYTPYPTLLCQAEYFYDSKVTITTYQIPDITGPNITSITYKNVGHADLLDKWWANWAKQSSLWVAASAVNQPFDRWCGIQKVDLSEYHEKIARDAIEFLVK